MRKGIAWAIVCLIVATGVVRWGRCSLCSLYGWVNFRANRNVVYQMLALGEKR
jgi:hypothetical protein